MTTGIIYMYTSPSGKSYIGQTVREDLRRKLWKSSRYHYAGDKIDRARAKYGADAFSYTILFKKDFDSLEEAVECLNEKEQYYISEYDTLLNGYNCDPGGEGHAHHTGATHHRRGYTLSEETKRRIGEGSRSWQNTPEGKAKMSAVRKGIPRHKGYRVESLFTAIVQLDLDGNYIQEFPSIKDAQNYLNNKADSPKTGYNISAVCNGKRDSAQGYKWLFSNDYYTYFLHPETENIPERVIRALKSIEKRHNQIVGRKSSIIKQPRISKFAQQIGQYDQDFQLVKVWRCVRDAASELHISESNIYRAKATLGQYQGFYWRNYEGQLICTPKPRLKVSKPSLNKSVVQMDLAGNSINVYDSIGQACEALGVMNRTCLSKCLNGKAQTAYGYKWEFLKCA